MSFLCPYYVYAERAHALGQPQVTGPQVKYTYTEYEKKFRFCTRDQYPSLMNPPSESKVLQEQH
jgi:hypothetical protein